MGPDRPDTCTLAEAACGWKKRMTQRRPSCVRAGWGPRSAKGSAFRPPRKASICASICDSAVACGETELSACCSGTIQISQDIAACAAGSGWMLSHVNSILGGNRGISHRTPLECATTGALRQSTGAPWQGLAGSVTVGSAGPHCFTTTSAHSVRLDELVTTSDCYTRFR